MLAIFKHELRALFHSFTAYVFGAFLLVVVGLGALAYNLQAAVSNFEYVLSFAGIIFVVIVPLLTMRVIAEERRQKTDQLLYALPISTTDVVLGKYAALLVVFLVPLAVIAVYPLIFSCFGEVYLPVSYGSIFAYFVMGAALIAVGVFLSSLTENQGMAASPCWATPSPRRSLKAARKKSATASSAITRFAKARSPITGAAPGCAPRPARITPRPSKTSC